MRWDDGIPPAVALETVVPDKADWIAYAASGINDLGQITGNITPSDASKAHAFIYDPVAGTLVILEQLHGDSTSY